jgi:hypothetical protein
LTATSLPSPFPRSPSAFPHARQQASWTSSLRKETAQSLAVAVEAIAQRVYEVDDVAGVEA